MCEIENVDYYYKLDECERLNGGIVAGCSQLHDSVCSIDRNFHYEVAPNSCDACYAKKAKYYFKGDCPRVGKRLCSKEDTNASCKNITHFAPVCGHLSDGTLKNYKNEYEACTDRLLTSYTIGSC